jgi:hypothetical protein
MAREPGYCKHKPTGQAYVNLGGKVIYLGVHGTEESKERYNRVKAEWLVNRHAAQFQPTQSAGPFVSDLCNAFLDHAEVYYPTSDELKLFKLAVQPLSDLFARLPTLNFGTTEFKVCRNWWLIHQLLTGLACGDVFGTPGKRANLAGRLLSMGAWILPF